MVLLTLLFSWYHSRGKNLYSSWYTTHCQVCQTSPCSMEATLAHTHCVNTRKIIPPPTHYSCHFTHILSCLLKTFLVKESSRPTF